MKPGRPSKAEGERITVDLPLKISRETNDALRRVAQEHAMSSAQYVRSLLVIHLNKLRLADTKAETTP